MWWERIKELVTPVNVGYVIAAGALVHLMIQTFIHRKGLAEGLRGEDGRWQFIEWAQLVWAVLFPTLVICDLYGLHASIHVWTSVDAVYLISVGGKVGSKYFESRKEVK